MLILRLPAEVMGPHVSYGRKRASRGERGQNGMLHRFSEEIGGFRSEGLATAQRNEKGTAIAVPFTGSGRCRVLTGLLKMLWEVLTLLARVPSHSLGHLHALLVVMLPAPIPITL